MDAISQRDSVGAERAMRRVLGHFPGNVEFFFGHIGLRSVVTTPEPPAKRKRSGK